MPAPRSRSRSRWIPALACAFALGPVAGAKDLSGLRWNFTLPTLEGARFIALADIRGPVLVNFWGRDCPPCMAELPRLQAFALAHPKWTVVLVSTDSPDLALEALNRRGIALLALRKGANVAGLMRAAGNTSGGLPYSVSARNAIICRAGAGEISPALLAQWAEEC